MKKLVRKEYEIFSEFICLCKVSLCITVGNNLRNLYVWESISKYFAVFGLKYFSPMNTLVNSYKRLVRIYQSHVSDLQKFMLWSQFVRI